MLEGHIILDFLEREEVISDYDIENGTFGENEISFVRTIYEEDKIYNIPIDVDTIEKGYPILCA